MKIITNQQVKQLVTMTEAIEAMRDAFADISSSDAEIPVRTALVNIDDKSCLLTMPCYSRKKNIYSVKLVSVFPSNQQKGIPIIHGKLMLFDGVNGLPLALMDAEYLTALRTGAASGLASEILSKRDASVLAIVGTGRQAWHQVEAILAVRTIKKILVKGRSEAGVASFNERLKTKFSGMVKQLSKEEELQEADVICTATNSSHPVIWDKFIKPAAHINAIGGYQPNMQEIPSSIMKDACIIVDQREAAFKEAGDIIIPMNEGIINPTNIQAELGELVLQTKSVSKDNQQISVFKSVGNAMQDLMLGNLVLQKI